MLQKNHILLILMFLCAFATPEWFTYTYPTQYDLYAVEMRSDTYGWFAGINQIARWNGAHWQASNVTGGPYIINAISATADSNAWCCGAGGTILDYSGSIWNSITSPTTQDLYAMRMISTGVGWILGTQVILQYNGSIWGIYPQGGLAYNWRGIWGDSVSNVWIVGGPGKSAHYNGVQFTEYPTPVTDTIYSVSFYDSNHGFACTSNGRILYWNGSSWSIHSQPVPTKLYSIAMTSSTHGWCMGENGMILEYNGSTWNNYPSFPPFNDINAVSMGSDVFGFAVGDNGTVLEYADRDTVLPTSLGNLRALYH